MALKRRLILIAGLLALCSIMALSIFHLLPLDFLSVQQKPEQTPQKAYDYYIVMDETDGHTLMYVPIVVSVGDEVLSEDNKLYRVVKTEENRAYARFVRNVDLEKQILEKP